MQTLPFLIVALLAPAQNNGGPAARSSIIDTARLFTPAVVQQAEAELRKAEAKTRIPVVIETVESLRGETIGQAAINRARQQESAGVFLLISKEDHKLSGLLVRREYGEKLPEARRTEIRDAIVDAFKEKRFDEGLRLGVGLLTEALSPAEPPPTVPRSRQNPEDGAVVVETAPLVQRNQARLTLAGARKVIAGAEALAQQRGWKMNIAVVDDGGHLLAFARMDGARPASVATANTKAVSAATYRAPTGPQPSPTGEPDVLLNLSLQNAAAMGGGKLTTLYGGVPIIVDNQVIGAVGVGGGSGEQDAQVARAGVEAFLKELTPARER